MSATVTINPLLTTNALGSFDVSSVGTVQGTFYDDPAVRYALAGGVLSAAETLPMWGGVGIYEDVPGAAGGPAGVLGGQVGRATALTGSKALTGFSVFNQAHAMIQSPQSPVPLAPAGGQVNFFRLGSGARIAVECDPALASLEGLIINTQVSWDFVNQLLVPYVGTLTISSGTYVSATGIVTLTMSAPITFSPGDAIIISSLTGSGAYASLNGTFTALAGTTGSTVVYNAGEGLGSAAITGGSLTLGSGASSALPVKVLDIQIGNSMTVVFDPVTGFATFNRTGNTAIILI
jgi:hypothetical protein